MLRPALLPLLLLAVAEPVASQVHYHPDGRPWNQRARGGPDAEVDGWYYNLGITGIRVELREEARSHLFVRHVFDDTPADRKVRVGDAIVGAGARAFRTEHRNGYGMDVFGADGPILELAEALERAQSKAGKGRLSLRLEREGELVDVTLNVGRKYGTYSRSFPNDCKKSDRIEEELLDWLVEEQREDGAWGNPVHNTYAPLALLSRGRRDDLRAVEKCAKWHARETRADPDQGGLVNWRYCAAGIVMAEYYLATKERWVLPELQEVYDFLIYSQYMHPSQINPKSRESHPGSVPKDDLRKVGGWGHKPGFEGYGPICMITGQAALALALMQRCGIEVDRERLDAAYAFLERGTGRNGYVWYEDSANRHRDWADMGRTGATGIANWMSPYGGREYERRAKANAVCIGEHPESFPDTHGSPILGMGYAALAAAIDGKSFRSLMDANRWWFTLAQCADGTFYYQPNRDNAGYGSDARLSASSVTAFILAIPDGNLAITGKGR